MNFATEENVRRGLSLARAERQAATEAEPCDQSVDHAWLAVCEVLEKHLRDMSGTSQALEELQRRLLQGDQSNPQTDSN